MIDRRKSAKRAKRDGQKRKVRGKRRGSQRGAAAKIEQHHHVAAAPAVPEPAGGQREYTERDERGRTQRNHFRIAASINDRELDYRGREDEHHVMIDRMRPIDEPDRKLPRPIVGGDCCMLWRETGHRQTPKWRPTAGGKRASPHDQTNLQQETPGCHPGLRRESTKGRRMGRGKVRESVSKDTPWRTLPKPIMGRVTAWNDGFRN